MPSQYVTKPECKACKSEHMNKNSITWGLLGLIIAIGGYVGYGAVVAANEASAASCLIGDHIAADTVEKQAITRTLERVEARQIEAGKLAEARQMEMGKRIDGIFQKLGE